MDYLRYNPAPGHARSTVTVTGTPKPQEALREDHLNSIRANSSRKSAFISKYVKYYSLEPKPTPVLGRASAYVSSKITDLTHAFKAPTPTPTPTPEPDEPDDPVWDELSSIRSSLHSRESAFLSQFNSLSANPTPSLSAASSYLSSKISRLTNIFKAATPTPTPTPTPSPTPSPTPTPTPEPPLLSQWSSAYHSSLLSLDSGYSSLTSRLEEEGPRPMLQAGASAAKSKYERLTSFFNNEEAMSSAFSASLAAAVSRVTNLKDFWTSKVINVDPKTLGVNRESFPWATATLTADHEIAYPDLEFYEYLRLGRLTLTVILAWIIFGTIRRWTETLVRKVMERDPQIRRINEYLRRRSARGDEGRHSPVTYDYTSVSMVTPAPSDDVVERVEGSEGSGQGRGKTIRGRRKGTTDVENVNVEAVRDKNGKVIGRKRSARGVNIEDGKKRTYEEQWLASWGALD